MSKFLYEPLSKRHDRKRFRCGISEWDEYLHRQAGQDMRRKVAAVFVVVPDDEPGRVAGYYTLSSASIILTDLPEAVSRKLPRYPTVPAVLIGRLARDVNFPGVGKLLLHDALARGLRHASEVASAVVVVDAKNETAREFYLRFGFAEIEGLSKRMFLPMTEVEKLRPGE